MTHAALRARAHPLHAGLSCVEAARVASHRRIISFAIRFDPLNFCCRNSRCDFVIILASGYTRS
ncbi:hypothetical protein CO709_05335 [Burkholderia thailandensis]|nr:hypothetical protein CO709_05335 [Burkholderia thailandensis]